MFPAGSKVLYEGSLEKTEVSRPEKNALSQLDGEYERGATDTGGGRDSPC
jgi:hypothetical protein